MADFRWSFSQWETYNSCPAKWKFKSVLKLPSAPPGPAAARGLQIHGSVEDYIGGKSSEVHSAVKPKFIPIFNQLRNHPNGERHTELRMSLTEDWQLAGGLRSKSAWCVLVIDAVRVGGAWNGPDKGKGPNIAWVYEWKSGKPKDTHGDQRKLYALASIIKWPWVDEVQATTYYLEDTAPPQKLRCTPSAADKLKALWQGRVDLMRRDTICGPRPGYHCMWCDYAKKRGGPCDFGG